SYSNPDTSRPVCKAFSLVRAQIGHPVAPFRSPRKQTQVRLTDEELDVVIAGYESGLTLNELATAFGADHRTLANRLEGRDVPRRGPRLSYEQLQEAIALYGRGWSLSRI